MRRQCANMTRDERLSVLLLKEIMFFNARNFIHAPVGLLVAYPYIQYLYLLYGDSIYS